MVARLALLLTIASIAAVVSAPALAQMKLSTLPPHSSQISGPVET